MRTQVMYNDAGVFRAQIVQGQQAQVGPLLIGVMVARTGTLEDGSTGLMAKLRLVYDETSRIDVLHPGESLELEGVGTLTLVAVRPPDPEQPESVESTNRGVVALEFTPPARRLNLL